MPSRREQSQKNATAANGGRDRSDDRAGHSSSTPEICEREPALFSRADRARAQIRPFLLRHSSVRRVATRRRHGRSSARARREPRARPGGERQWSPRTVAVLARRNGARPERRRDHEIASSNRRDPRLLSTRSCRPPPRVTHGPRRPGRRGRHPRTVPTAFVAVLARTAGPAERGADIRSGRAAGVVDNQSGRDADWHELRQRGRGRELQRAASGFIRCWLMAITPVRRGPVRCARATPARTLQPIRSRSQRPHRNGSAEHIEDIELLLRIDSAGACHELVDWCRDARMRFSVGSDLTDTVRAAIHEFPMSEGRGSRLRRRRATERARRRDHRAARPQWLAAGSRALRRERAYPGAQLTFTDHDGHRFQAVPTDQPDTNIAAPERDRRARTRVEDHVRRHRRRMSTVGARRPWERQMLTHSVPSPAARRGVVAGDDHPHDH